LLDLLLLDREHPDPLPAQRSRSGDVLGIRDGLVSGPDLLVIGHDPPVAEHSHPCQVGDHLDAPPMTAGCTE
jgi:hypothetical protein